MRHVHCCTLLCAQGAGCAASACARRAALATACCCMAVRTTACKTGLVIATLVRCGGGRSKVYKGKPCAADSHGRHRFRTARFAAAHRFRSLRLVFGPRHAAASVPHREVLSNLAFRGTSLHSSTRWRGRVLQSSGRNARVLRATAAAGALCQLARESALPESAAPTWQLHRWRGRCAGDAACLLRGCLV